MASVAWWAAQWSALTRSGRSRGTQASGLARASSNPGTAGQFFPILQWLPNYRREDLPSDLMAGTIIAIMLIPQAMAYAMIAGLPPQVGLYSSILPLLVYAVLGTSRTLSTGPVAIVSLMVASTLAPLATPGSSEYVVFAVALAALSGLMMVALGLLHAGSLTHFVSHPVISGFTTAAALIIGFSQLGHLLGINLERTHLIPVTVWEAFQRREEIAPVTVTIAALSLLLLLGRNVIARALKSLRLIGETGSEILPKAMPLFVAMLAAALVWYLDLASRGVKIVGHIPAGLPDLTMPQLSWPIVQQLAGSALLIAAIGFLESISVARTLASKRRQKILPNQELIGIGAANISSALTGGYPVAGSFSRSIVNFSTGAQTQLSGIIAAVLIAITLVLLTPMLYYLPRATLASIIVMAVTGLVDFSPLVRTWRYMKLDGVSFVATFLGVLALGVEEGILLGAALSIVFFLWRTSNPSIVIVGRLGNSEQFRDARFHEVKTYPNVLMMRVDMSLYFANAAALEDRVLRYVADHPEVEHFVLVCVAMNMIDASALETIESLHGRLKDAGVTMHLAAVKSTVLRRMRAVDFLEKIAPGRVFISAHDAAVALARPEPRPEEAGAGAAQSAASAHAASAAVAAVQKASSMGSTAEAAPAAAAPGQGSLLPAS